MGKKIRRIIMAALLVVFLGSTAVILYVQRQYRISEELYSQASGQYAVSMQEEPDADSQTSAPIQVDFDALRAENADVVGWIYCEGTPIDYPVVQCADNDYYLHHTVEKKKNFSGSIFMETKNSSQFTDSHTIIYGHNMKNGSMFGKLKRIRQLEMTEEDYKFWILTPGKNQLCRVFSAQEVESGGEAYTLFTGPCQEFRDWADKMSRTSVVDPGEITLWETDRIITLSTCTGNDTTRFIVQGICQ